MIRLTVGTKAHKEIMAQVKELSYHDTIALMNANGSNKLLARLFLHAHQEREMRTKKQAK